jgi:site-specific recombinase XerD
VRFLGEASQLDREEREMSTNAGLTFAPEPLTEAEAQRLLDSIRGDGPIAARNRALVAMLWRSGLRVSELLSLKPADVDLQAGTVRVLKGKGGGDRVSTIDYRAISHVRYWLAVRHDLGLNGRQRLFCSIGSGETRRPGRPMHPSYCRRLLPKLAVSAGLSKRCHPHGLRHTFANELLDRGVPLQHISAALGHAHISTTNIYLRRMNPADTVAAIRAAGMTVHEP